MKSRLFFAAAIMGIAGVSKADINITLPSGSDITTVQYFYVPIKQFAEAKSRADRGIMQDSISLTNHKGIIPVPNDNQGYMYGLMISGNPETIYATGDAPIDMTVLSVSPYVDYVLSGSPMAEAQNSLNQAEKQIKERQAAMSDTPESELIQLQEQLYTDYVDLLNNFLSNNPTSEAAPFAILKLDGADFINAYEGQEDNLKNSVVYPLLSKQYAAEKRSQEMEQKQQALSSGEIEAPNFTLKDLDGKDVSLSDFKGKWVILDFWGSWCPWCIKGFPELKEAYKKYAGKLEIIGIDCNESEKDWRAGVEKYELPWVNVYNPSDSSLTSDYGVQGFPTKAIVGPDGKIRNITVGHDPAFFDKLTELMGE